MDTKKSENNLIKEFWKDKKLDGKDIIFLESMSSRTKQSLIPLFQEMLEEKGYTIKNENDLKVFNHIYTLIFWKESWILKLNWNKISSMWIFLLKNNIKIEFLSLKIDKNGKIFLYKQANIEWSFWYIENGKFYENTNFSQIDYKWNNNNIEIQSLPSQEKIPNWYHHINKIYINGDTYIWETNIWKKWGKWVYSWWDNSSYKWEFYNGRINNTKGVYSNTSGIKFSWNFENQASNVQKDSIISKNTIKILNWVFAGMTLKEIDAISNLEAYLIKEKKEWFPEIRWKTIISSLVKVMWPDGTISETESDENWNYAIWATKKQNGWEIRVKIPTEEEYYEMISPLMAKRENIYNGRLLIYKWKKQKSELLKLDNPITNIPKLNRPKMNNSMINNPIIPIDPFLSKLQLVNNLIVNNPWLENLWFDYKNPKKQDIIDILKKEKNNDEKEKIYSPLFIYALQVSLSLLWQWTILGNIDGIWGRKTKKSLEILLSSKTNILSPKSIQNIINKLWII